NSENRSTRSEIQNLGPRFWEPKQSSESERQKTGLEPKPVRLSPMRLREVFSWILPFVCLLIFFRKAEASAQDSLEAFDSVYPSITESGVNHRLVPTQDRKEQSDPDRLCLKKRRTTN